MRVWDKELKTEGNRGRKLSYTAWHQQQIGGKVIYPTPLWRQQHLFPKWLQAKRIIPAKK